MKSLLMKLWCGISGKDYSAWKAEQMRKKAEEEYLLKKLARKIEEEIKLKEEIDLLEKESANIQKCFHELKSSSVFVDEQTLEEYHLPQPAYTYPSRVSLDTEYLCNILIYLIQSCFPIQSPRIS